MIQRGWIAFLLFVCCFSPLFATDTKQLSQDAYWLKLLHFRDGISEIDAPQFFLSPKGKTDPKAELEATIDALYHDKSVFCRFPARVRWLFAHVPKLEADVAYKPCKALETLKASYKTSKAVLIFPTAHINSPASMFGHTFLRLDDKSGLALTANAVNYAAKTAETNGLIFAYKGLFGGYEGRYSVLPYYKKIKEYNHLEHRDIWEYTLNLNEAELDRLLTHLYELRDVYANYYFFTENCSYNLLWLLEVARPSAHLVNQFYIKAIPIDTIRAIKKAGFITKAHFRPSKTKQIEALLKASKKAKGGLKKAYKAELDVALLQLKRSQGKIKKKPYIKALMEKLHKRSALEKIPKLTITPPANPLRAHKSARVTLGLDSKQRVRFGMKLAFHDIYDVDQGFVKGAYIDFFHLMLEKYKSEIKLQKLDLVNINSYALRDTIFSPISWGVAFGEQRFREQDNFSLRGEVGLSYALGERAFGFVMLAEKFYYHDKPLIGAGPKLGVLASFEKLKCGMIGEQDFYADGVKEAHGEVFGTIMIGKESAINLKAKYDKIDKEKANHSIAASLFYYF